jgi:hypothetical protein
MLSSREKCASEFLRDSNGLNHRESPTNQLETQTSVASKTRRMDTPPDVGEMEAVREKESVPDVRSPALTWLPIVDVIRTYSPDILGPCFI